MCGEILSDTLFSRMGPSRLRVSSTRGARPRRWGAVPTWHPTHRGTSIRQRAPLANRA